MTTNEFITYVVLLGSIVIFGGAAILALAWAVRDGQFENFERSARSIFDPAEPVGEMTDRFPESAPRGADRSAARGADIPVCLASMADRSAARGADIPVCLPSMADRNVCPTGEDE